ncbi:putative nucleotidyltransferase [Caldisphaera lagunensis DSM 15908]|uniref:Putative nucleotidyltransferase n=1 Tax=Caldisphaera lagunensis (strain DSM 15908 / JCM 11604 / ANMR 0165 / IC-154) TaxID=1056495 RepID=L0AB65_CALLD|nr:nucleotidyltransferase [Caldisphaera lagunensis]AFZ70387.1 putative nucleotidyltransferase [Caldisphaera lagunensis DSM 15908]
MVSLKAFVEILRKLLDEGVKFTIIGDTVILLNIKSEDLGEDIDLFVESPSILENENFYEELSNKNKWSYGKTWLGTPRITAVIFNEEINLDLYENLYDFYIPNSFINNAQRIDINGLRLKTISIEQYLVLKSYSGKEEDIEKLKDILNIIKKNKIRIHEDKIVEAAKEVGEENTILRKLKELGYLR